MPSWQLERDPALCASLRDECARLADDARGGDPLRAAIVTDVVVPCVTALVQTKEKTS